jgi:hypothetical protein
VAIAVQTVNDSARKTVAGFEEKAWNNNASSRRDLT